MSRICSIASVTVVFVALNLLSLTAATSSRGSPLAHNTDDAVQAIVLLRKGEQSLPAVRDVKVKYAELNDTPGKLLPGVKLDVSDADIRRAKPGTVLRIRPQIGGAPANAKAFRIVYRSTGLKPKYQRPYFEYAKSISDSELGDLEDE